MLVVQKLHIFTLSMMNVSHISSFFGKKWQTINKQCIYLNMYFNSINISLLVH